MKKRLLSAFLSLCMVLTLLPATALAAPVSETDWNDMVRYYEQFQQEYEAGDLQWSTLGNAALNYNIVTADDAELMVEQTEQLQTITAYFEGLTELDMSGKSAGIMAGALSLLGNLETLNISDTGVTNLGGLATLTKLKSLDASDNPAVDDLGALAACTQITELNLSGTGIDSNDFGALVQMPLVSLNLSGTQIASIGPLTTNGSNPACAETLEELNISNTKVTQLQEVWNNTTQSSSLPNLKTLTAQGLELTSISGLAEIVDDEDAFDPEGISWNLSGSTLTDTTNGVSHVNQILSKFGSSGSFVAPTQEGEGVVGIPASVSSAQNWKNALVDALGTDGGKENLTWDTLITAVYWYETATDEVEALSNDTTKTTCNSILESIKTAFENIKTLDMSDKSNSRYAISTGVLVHFTGLTDLNLSNTGISDTGGLAGLTSLETLDLSDNRGIDNTNFGALAGMSNLEELNLSGTGITDIGGLTEGDEDITDSNGVADTLTTLDISNTGVTQLESIWGADSATSPAFSALKTLTAQNLALESISGLARIAEQDSFTASDYTWDLSGSTLTGTAANGTDLAAIQTKFGDSSNFSSPAYTASVADDLTNAQAALDSLEAELESDNKASWDTLITAVYYYQQAQNYVNGLTEGDEKTVAQATLSEITNGFAAITTLDMSDQSTSRYTISTGALEPFTGLTSLNLSNTGIRDTGGLAGLTSLETLDLSGNPGINNTHFGALANMSALKELNLSGTSITDIGGLTGDDGSGVADTLTTLDISNTGVTRLESVWDGTTPAFPNLTTLVAQGLELESISGLVEISNAGGFQAEGTTWDLSGSSLTNTETNLSHVSELRDAFASAGTFNPPTIPVENMPQALESAIDYKDGFNDAVATGQLDWDYLITAIYWLRTAANSWTGLTSDTARAQCEATWNDIKTFYANITELDMSNQSESERGFEISTGALTDFVGLTDLNLSNTGIRDTGGLVGLTKLETLDLSGNSGITDANFGALANMSALKELNLSGTGITDIGGLTEGDEDITGSNGVADTLTTLDISNTGVTKLESIWNGTTSAFPALKSLVAQNLTLDSISGLVEIVSQTGFTGEGYTWNLSGSTMPETNSHGDYNQAHVDTITAKLGENFTPPTVETEEPTPEPEPEPEETYTITFDVNATGASVTPATMETDTDGRLTSLPTPTRSGSYHFDGWFTATSGGTQITATHVFTEDTTLYAHWTYNGGGGGSSGGGGGGGGSSSSGYTITVEDADNGSIRVSPTRASRGDTVTITVSPATGYELDELVVTDASGDEVELTCVSSTRYTFEMPRSRVTVEATFAKIEEEEPSTPLTFVDVPTSAYYYDAVYWAVEHGVTNGTSATTFSPDRTVTRAEMVTFLWRAHGSPVATDSNPFIDVGSDSYYYDAVLWAVENGITNGTSATTFSPDATVTRAQAVTFQWRAAGSPSVSGGSFDDVAADTYYATAVAWAVENGITNGTGGNNFSPDVGVSRAQAVTFLWRELA